MNAVNAYFLEKMAGAVRFELAHALLAFTQKPAVFKEITDFQNYIRIVLMTQDELKIRWVVRNG